MGRFLTPTQATVRPLSEPLTGDLRASLASECLQNYPRSRNSPSTPRDPGGDLRWPLDITGATAYGTRMNSQPVPTTDLLILEPAAVADRAIIAWDWYYFTEACLVMRGVAHH